MKSQWIYRGAHLVKPIKVQMDTPHCINPLSTNIWIRSGSHGIKRKEAPKDKGPKA